MFLLSDRVKQTSITVGTGSPVFNGVFGGFSSFSKDIGNGNSTYYTIENNSNYEVGIGTYHSSDNSLSRDTVLISSNNNQKIYLDGVSIIFCTYPAAKAFALDKDGYGCNFSSQYAGIRFPDNTIQVTAATNDTRSKQYATISSSTSVSLDKEIYFLDCSTNNVTLTLPSAIDQGGKVTIFKHAGGSNLATLIPQENETIDAQTIFKLPYSFTSISIISNNENWFII